MKSSDHTNDNKANCKYKTISFYVFTLPNASNLWIYTLFVLICEITKQLQTSFQFYIVIYHTNQNLFSNFTNENKQCVDSQVASIWKCKNIEWDRLIFTICFIIVGMITWFHQFYRINCTIIWLPKWCKQIFCLNKSNNYCSILPLIDVLSIYY